MMIQGKKEHLVFKERKKEYFSFFASLCFSLLSLLSATGFCIDTLTSLGKKDEAVGSAVVSYLI